MTAILVSFLSFERPFFLIYLNREQFWGWFLMWSTMSITVGTGAVTGRYGSHLPLLHKAGVAFPYTLISATVAQSTPPSHPLRSCKSSTFRRNEKNYKGRERSGNLLFHSVTQPLLDSPPAPNRTESTPIFYIYLNHPLLRSESSRLLRNSARRPLKAKIDYKFLCTLFKLQGVAFGFHEAGMVLILQGFGMEHRILVENWKKIVSQSYVRKVIKFQKRKSIFNHIVDFLIKKDKFSTKNLMRISYLK